MSNDALKPWDFQAKAWFKANKAFASRHNDFFESEAATLAIQVAFAEMAYKLAGRDAIERTHNASKLEGAKEFIRILMNLGRDEPPPPKTEAELYPFLKR